MLSRVIYVIPVGYEYLPADPVFMHIYNGVSFLGKLLRECHELVDMCAC